MNDLPDELVAKIFASSDHATKAAAMFASKSFLRVIDTYDDLWTDAEFKKYDDTLVGFFERHKVRTLRLTCTLEDIIQILKCNVQYLEKLSLRIRYTYDVPMDLSVAIRANASKLETLELVIDKIGTGSSFVVPWTPSLKNVTIIEKSCTPQLDVSFYRWEYPNLERVDIRSRSCTFASRASRCTKLRDVRLLQTYHQDQRANFDGLVLDHLEINAEESFDVTAKKLVVCVDGYGSFRRPFDAEHVTFRFASNECYLDVHNDVIRDSESITFEPGIRYTPFVSWHINVENSPISDARKIIVRDPRVTLNFVNVQFKYEP